MKPRNIFLTLTLLIGVSFTSLSAQEFFEEEFVQKMSFEEKLMHVRGIMIEGDERANLGRSQKNIDKALTGFLETEFMHKFKEIKLEAETLAATFKAHSQQFTPEEVAEVKIAYTQIADKFNQLLVDIKNDFMDRKKMKVIKDEPDMYSNSLQFKLYELKDEYSRNFEVVVAEMTGSDMYSAVPLAAIFGLIKLAVDITNYIAAANFEARRIKEDHLREYFLMPYSFRPWIEIEISDGDIYKHAMENQDYQPMDEEINPFEEDINSAKPKKKKNNNN